MASQSQGVHQLLQAQKQAAEKVADARKRKALCLSRQRRRRRWGWSCTRERERERERESKRESKHRNSRASSRPGFIIPEKEIKTSDLK
uniref:Uncharacterized protein n=1 Tax=Suricata suricatta TaxID=37032 RepID=A0A673TLA7_SURSU